MNELFHKLISASSGINERQVTRTLDLLNNGATIPFISRYRKEVTGGLDEVQVEEIKTQHERLCDLAKRKETIINTVSELGKMTPELKSVLMNAGTARCWKIFICLINLNGRRVPKPPDRKGLNRLQHC